MYIGYRLELSTARVHTQLERGVASGGPLAQLVGGGLPRWDRWIVGRAQHPAARDRIYGY